MKPVKALTGKIEDVHNLQLHILLTEEDNVIVARCLDFSISSHGENEMDALDSLSDCIKEYLDHAIKKNALNEVIDPEDKNYWGIYTKLMLEGESLTIRESVHLLKAEKIKEVIYA
mgnify:CR=1 FL=1